MSEISVFAELPTPVSLKALYDPDRTKFSLKRRFPGIPDGENRMILSFCVSCIQCRLVTDGHRVRCAIQYCCRA